MILIETKFIDFKCLHMRSSRAEARPFCWQKLMIGGPVWDLLGIPFEILGLRAAVELPFVTASGEVSRGEKVALQRTEPESYITEYTLSHEHKSW